MGKLLQGITVEPTQKQKMTMSLIGALRDQQDKVFATHKKLKLGPGDYDAEYSQTKARS